MKKKHLPEQLHIAAASGIFLTILVLVYLIAGRHNRRIDLTRDKIHSVSVETVQVLSRMTEGEIVVRAFFAEEDPARREFRILLQEMATHHPRFRYEFYDPDRAPSEARRWHVDAYRTTVIQHRGREERLQDFTEEALTNALIRAAHPQKRTLCFTTGHGEAALSGEERSGLSEWRQVLEHHRYQLREIQILTEGIPQDCTSVVVAGPRYELLARELDLLQKYAETGRGLFLLIDPMDPGTGKSFQELVKPFGLKLGEDVVVDKVSRVLGGDYLVPLVAQYAEHPVTKRFRVATFLPVARSVRKTAQVPAGIDVTELARTTPGSWAETDLKKLENGEAKLDTETDLVGPVPLAAAVEIKEKSRVSGPRGRGARLVVVGDSDFLTNAHLKVSGNRDFGLNVLEWLVRDDRWISIRARTPRFEPLFLKANESLGVAVFSVGVLPFGVLLGSSTAIRIRRKRSA